jgi:hypothetical protein
LYGNAAALSIEYGGVEVDGGGTALAAAFQASTRELDGFCNVLLFQLASAALLSSAAVFAHVRVPRHDRFRDKHSSDASDQLQERFAAFAWNALNLR